MWLLHGTTRARAEAIISRGPDIHYVEPGGLTEAENFSFCIEGHPSVLRPAEEYARGKARAFPADRGAVILAVDVPDAVVEMAARELMGPLQDYLAAMVEDGPAPADDLPALLRSCGGVIQFDPGPALESLLAAWAGLPKEIRSVP
jgi:hypothetical protein